MRLTAKEVRRIDRESSLLTISRPWKGGHRVYLMFVSFENNEVVEATEISSAVVGSGQYTSIGAAAAALLRQHDKCGGSSKYTRSSRSRAGRKGR